MKWWKEWEATPTGAQPRARTFSKAGEREGYATMLALVFSMPMLPMDETMHELGEACDDGCGA